MIKLTVLFALFFTITKSYSAPTHEALFKSSGSPESSLSTVVLKLQISRELSGQSLLTPISSAGENISSAIKENTVFAKITLERGRGDVEVLQTIHSALPMTERNIITAMYKQNLSRTILHESKPERSLFFSLILNQVFGETKTIVEFFRSIDSSFKTDKELLDPEKVAFFESYKQFLMEEEKNKETSVESGANSPMMPTSPEAKDALAKAMNGPLYKDGDGVMLHREKGEFFWQLLLPNIFALIGVEKRDLRVVKLRTNDGETLVNLEELNQFMSSVRFPSLILFKESAGAYYKIKVLELSGGITKPQSLSEKFKAQQQAILKGEGQPALIPAFLL